MRKLNFYSLIAMVVLCIQSAYADPFPEDFEDLALDAKGWIMQSAEGTNFSWSVIDYSSDFNFSFTIPIIEDGGQKVLLSKTGGSGFSGTTAADNRLISPEFTVDNRYLTFMMACNMSMNDNTSIGDNAKSKLEVKVSDTAATTEDAFTDVVYSYMPIGLELWKVVQIDLSEYSGQNIRLMFRNYQGEVVKNFVSNTLYIDNLTLTDDALIDVKLQNLTGLYNSTEKEQPLAVTLVSNAAPFGEATLRVSVNGSEQFSEVVTSNISGGESLIYEFTRNVTLQEGDNEVVVTADISGDGYPDNNTASATTYIYPTTELPFILSADVTEMADDMISTFHGSIRNPNGWDYMNNFGWVHTNQGNQAFLHTADAYRLNEASVLKITASGSPTGTQAVMSAYIARRPDAFTEPLGQILFTQTTSEGVMLVPVKEAGEYLIAFAISGDNMFDQFNLLSLSIEEASELPDVAVTDIYPYKVIADTDTSFSVSLRNDGAADATDVNVVLTIGDVTLTGVVPLVKSGETCRYEFPETACLSVGEYELNVEASTIGDMNTDNDRLSKHIVSYAPRTLPYRESFEDETETALWNFVSPDIDNTIWRAAGGYEFDGTHMMVLPQSETDHDDWAISPAITIPADYSGRLSFYYGSGGNSGTSHIQVYLSKSADIADIISDGKLLSDFATDKINIAYASEQVYIADEGTYYIAFHAVDGTQSLLVDDLRLDNSEEVILTAASVDVTGAEYEPEDAVVTMRGRNCGLSAINGFRASYTIYLTSNGETESIATVQEVCTGSIAAGEDFSFDFADKVKFTREGIYNIVTAIQVDNDGDNKNNSYTAQGPEKLATMQMPALWNMELSDQLHGFTISDPWGIGAINPYADTFSLAHVGSVSDAEAGDLVILNRAYIPAGTYQLSFFWKTVAGQTGKDYNQTFDILLGDAPQRDALSKTIFSVTEATAESKAHKKEMVDLVVDHDGYYWLAINLKEAGALGSLSIDNIKIEIPEALMTLDEKTPIYEADFLNREEQWQHYHPNHMCAQQWERIVDDTESSAFMQVSEYMNFDGSLQYKGSWYQAPALELLAGKIYDITLETQILPIADDKPLSGDEAIMVYDSSRDLPSEFVQIGTATQNTSDGIVAQTIRIIPEETGLHYITLLPYCQSDAIFRLHSFQVAYSEQNNVDSNISQHDSWQLIDGRLIVNEGDAVSVYTITGVRIKVCGGDSMPLAPNTIYIIVDSEGNSNKIITK